MIGVILAAGKGSRLGKHTVELPKSLLSLNNTTTLLDYNITLLQKFNLDKIIIVTGFNSEKIETHVNDYKDIEIVYNPFWNHCNVLGSLYMTLDKIDDDFLFLHADTLAQIEIWEKLILSEGDMVLPFERKQCGKEEMKILLDGEKLKTISKEIDSDCAAGEFLGIAKFKRSTVPFFKNSAELLFKTGVLNQYMEAVIQMAVDKGCFDINVLDIEDLKFVEVDFEEDYLRAKKIFGDVIY